MLRDYYFKIKWVPHTCQSHSDQEALGGTGHLVQYHSNNPRVSHQTAVKLHPQLSNTTISSCEKPTDKMQTLFPVNDSSTLLARGSQIHSPHPHPKPCHSPGSPWTERDVEFLGVKQRDLLGADQEAEPCALVLIRWQ